MLEDLAQVVDKIARSLLLCRPLSLPLARPPARWTKVMELRAEITWLTNSFRKEVRTCTPPKHTNPPPTGLCWYHERFGKDAKKCKEPCTWRPLLAAGNMDRPLPQLFFVTDRQSGTRFLIDSGAEVSVIPPSRMDKQHKQAYYTGPPLKAYYNNYIWFTFLHP